MITELVCRAGQLLTFLHDRAFDRLSGRDRGRLRLFLGFVETSEVILELGGYVVSGSVGRWAVIVVVQVLK